MAKLFIEDLDIKGKRVLMRVDFNVPLKEGSVADATRIEASLPSIRYVLDKGGALILMSHLGRPKGKKNPEFSLSPVAKELEKLLGRPVLLAIDCIGEEVKKTVNALKPGDVLLLENLRFHRAEEHPDEDPAFAQKLASLGTLYVNDAFGSSHRKHSSTYTVPGLFPGKAAAGYLLELEIRFLGEALTNPKRPFYALLGGAKISTKIGVVNSLVKKVDRLLLGGGMAYTFLKAQGYEIGKSLVEDDQLPLAKEILKLYGNKILLPIDCVAATESNEKAKIEIFPFPEGIPSDYEGVDIGPQTRELFKQSLKDGKTILWNGPFGIYEIDRFAEGTLDLVHEVAGLNATTIIGGGDLIAAVKKGGFSDKIAHLSTGGGATLEYIEHGTLPGIEVLSEKKESAKPR